ncbi:MAG: sugar transferase [Armatimonadota bacterium]
MKSDVQYDRKSALASPHTDCWCFRSDHTAKRLFDLALTIPGLILLSPLLGFVAVAVKLGDRGPVIFRQQRVGKNRVVFTILKFRSMHVDADQHGSLVTIGNDTRITPIGRVLRRTKLDELPQLVNVLRGEMSLVGPRPMVARYTDLFTPEQRQVLQLMPGITDPASLTYRHEQVYLGQFRDPEWVYIHTVLPHKLQINLGYASKANIGTDLMVILRTLFTR